MCLAANIWHKSVQLNIFLEIFLSDGPIGASLCNGTNMAHRNHRPNSSYDYCLLLMSVWNLQTITFWFYYANNQYKIRSNKESFHPGKNSISDRFPEIDFPLWWQFKIQGSIAIYSAQLINILIGGCNELIDWN